VDRWIFRNTPQGGDLSVFALFLALSCK
jgi:hypothetical protein